MDSYKTKKNFGDNEMSGTITFPLLEQLRSKYIKGTLKKEKYGAPNGKASHLSYSWTPCFPHEKASYNPDYPSLELDYFSNGKIRYIAYVMDGRTNKVLSKSESTFTEYGAMDAQRNFAYDLRRWFQSQNFIAPCLQKHIEKSIEFYNKSF